MRALLRAAGRSPYLPDGVALVYTATYAVWVLSHTPGTAVNDVIADVAFYPLGLALAWLYARNARASVRLGLDRRTRVAWSLLALGALLLWISGSAWSYFVRMTGPANTPGWIAGFEYLQLSLTIAAALAFPIRRPRPEERVRFGLDVALMLVASGILALHYGTSVIAPVDSVAGISLIAVRATLDIGVFFVLAVGVINKRDRTDRKVLACLLGANISVLVANWLLSVSTEYQSGSPVDLLWFQSWVLKWTAARYAWHQYRRGIRERPSDERGGGHAATLPHAIVAGAFALLVYQALTNAMGSIAGFVYAASGLTALLVLRQVAELRENQRLFDAQLALDARFRSLVQNSSDVVLVADGAGRVSYVSPSVVHVMGEGAIAPGMHLSEIIPVEDLAALDTHFDTAPGSPGRLQCRIQTPAGDWRDIEIVATDMRADPAIAGMVLNCRNVTERNELERQLHHAQKLDAVGHLAGGLAHDFNNVLAAIRGYTELLREDVPPASSAATDLALIEQSVDRAAAVTRKLLAFSRRQAVQTTVLDLNGVLVDLRPLLSQLVTERVGIRTSCESALWPVRADQGQMEQVIINLVTNARDAMPEGGTLDITTTNRLITAPAPETGGLGPGDYVAVIVSDQGTGMSEDVRRRIFEPFFSTKPKEKGMGLGLAMVDGIISQSGGRIVVDSTVGAGTTFTILLPRCAGTPDAAPVPRASPGPQRGSHGVLLVDDEPGVRAVTRRMLERAGYTVLEAGGGAEALALLEQHATMVDLLLTDLVMPGMHGRELISRFRERCPNAPVVCMTGFAGDVSEVRGPEAGVASVVSKPFPSEVLIRAVAAALATAAD